MSICSENEVLLPRAIYSRLKIKLGTEMTNCNIGVAQGSMISPALFDIFTESLILSLKDTGWSLEDILAFTDDHLIICDSVKDLERTISLVKHWCSNSNISLNSQKSGVLEIIPPRGKHSLSLNSTVADIPVVSSYKYLGVEFDHKLTGDLHMTTLI